MAEKDLESSQARARSVMLSVKDEQPTTPLSKPNPSNTPLHCLALLSLLLVIGLMILLESKYRHRQQSPFKTEGFFVYMCFVALAVGALTYLFLIINYDMRGSFVYTILKPVCFFSGILAPLSLVLVLCFPHHLKWVRYLSICLVFLIILVYNIIGYVRNSEDRRVIIKDKATIARDYLIKEMGN